MRMAKHFWLTLTCLLIFSLPSFALASSKTMEYETLLLNDVGLFDPARLTSAIAKQESSQNTMKNEKNEADYLSLVRLGIYYHNLAVGGYQKDYRGCAKKAYEILAKIIHEHQFPNELKPIAQPYLGSSRSMMGGETSNPIHKIGYVNEGITFLNEAVSKYQGVSYLPRFIRANVFIALPKFFNKEEQAFQDYLALEEWNKADSSRIPKPIMAEVDYNLGNCYKKRNKLDTAIEYWKIAYQFDREGAAGRKAKEMLKAFEAAYVE